MTSLEVPLVPRAPVLSPAPSAIATEHQSQEARWEVWLARGRVRDRRLLRRMGWLAGVLAVAFISWAGWSLAR